MDEIQEIAEKVAKQENFLKCEIETKPGAIKGDNYLSVINTADITGIDQRGEKKSLHLIIKTAIKNDSLRETVPIVEVFKREIFFYEKLFPTFLDFQEKCGVKNLFRSVPKFYYSSLEYKRETLVLENLKTVGYSMWDRQKPMPESHLKLIMREYGRLHAISFAMKAKNSEIYKELVDNLPELFTDQVEMWLESMKNGLSICIKYFDEEKDAEIIKRLEKYLEGLKDLMMKMMVNVVDDVYSVILHGDCWCNNLLFKYGVRISSCFALLT